MGPSDVGDVMCACRDVGVCSRGWGGVSAGGLLLPVVSYFSYFYLVFFFSRLLSM